MRTVFLWLFLPVIAAAQISVKVSGTTATQAVLQIRGATSDCTIDLREGAADGPLHPDVTASVDTGRADTIFWQDGTRVVTLGHQRSNLALAADTEYYGTLSGCGPATFQFRTKAPVLGAIMPTPLPVDPAKWHNADFPAIDWSPAGRDKWYTDPITGVKLKLVNRPEDFSWALKQDASFGTSSQGSHWAGGSGWTNPASAVNASASTARTSSTNPLILYPGLVGPWAANQMSIENIGVIVWGRCVSGSGEDCKVQIGVTYHPSEGFAGTPIELTIPSGASNTKVPGGSTHVYANGAFPTAYPQPLFAGWGDVRITHDMRYGPTWATSTQIENGVITISAPAPNIPGHFQRTLRAGHHIWVQDSGCTANGAPDICTVATNTDAGSLTLAETNVNSTGKGVRGLPWGIMVRKKTPTGTVQVGFAYRMSGANNSSTGTYKPVCSPIGQTDADGVKGHPCAVPERGGPYYMLYFISNDGEVVRPIAGLGSALTGGLFDQISFSPTQGNVMFAKAGNNIWRGTYNGNWKDSPWNTNATRYIFNPGGDYAYASVDENITWTKAISPDPATQINTEYPSQTSAPYPPWTTYGFVGVSGDIAVLYRLINGSLVGDTGPCQVAVFNLLSGKLLDLINTIEEGGPVAWGNCHSVGVNSLVDNTLFLSFNRLPRAPDEASTSRLSLGPHHMRIEAILKNGVWDSTVALGWPRNTSSFDSACPAGLSDDYTQLGAVGNNCITFLTSGNPCNVMPSGTASPPTGDFALYGACSWEPTYAGSPRLRPGHRFIDTWASNVIGMLDGDSEHFRVISVTEEGGGKLRVLAQFNASRDYCAGIGTPQPCYNCVASSNQMTHRAPWVGFTAMMMPGSKASCNAASIHVTYPSTSSPSKTYTELSNAFQGHSSYGRGPDGTFRYLAGSLVGTIPSFNALGTQPPIVSSLMPVGVKFNGTSAPIGSYYQQYLNHSQRAAADENTVFSFDANAVNPGVGISGNDMGNAIGPRPSSLFTRIIGDVWKLSAIDAVDYKNRPLLGWAGPKVLKDVSGPSSDISAAADYSFCYSYRAGECRVGSVQGDIYAKVPNAFRHSGWQADWCQTAMEFANIPCVLSGGPAAGYARQFRSDRPDTTGSDQRLLTMAFRPYGTHYPYWSVTAHPAGQVALLTSAGMLEGIRHVTLVAKLPRWVDTFPRRNTLGGVAVGIGAREGVTHARVKFGYNTSFRCTERSEACVTDNVIAPFAFEESDTLTPTSCASGCMISVPAMPGRLLYYRVETFDGSKWTSGDTMTAQP